MQLQVITKRCKTCRQVNAVEMFHIDVRLLSGFSGNCTECIKARKRAYAATMRVSSQPTMIEPPVDGRCPRCNSYIVQDADYPRCTVCGYEDYSIGRGIV